MRPDAVQLWRSLPEDRRQRAGESFYDDGTLREFQRAADTFIARARNFRPQFVRRLPVSKRAQYLAQLPLPPDFASQLLVSYHFSQQRPLMAAFLNALGIANDDGLIAEASEVTAPSAENLKAAVEGLRAQFPAGDVQLYLETLLVQSPRVWGGLQPLISAPAAAE